MFRERKAAETVNPPGIPTSTLILKRVHFSAHFAKIAATVPTASGNVIYRIYSSERQGKRVFDGNP